MTNKLQLQFLLIYEPLQPLDLICSIHSAQTRRAILMHVHPHVFNLRITGRNPIKSYVNAMSLCFYILAYFHSPQTKKRSAMQPMPSFASPLATAQPPDWLTQHFPLCHQRPPKVVFCNCASPTRLNARTCEVGITLAPHNQESWNYPLLGIFKRISKCYFSVATFSKHKAIPVQACRGP